MGGPQLQHRPMDWAQYDPKHLAALYEALTLGLIPSGQERGFSHCTRLGAITNASAELQGIFVDTHWRAVT